MWELPYPPSLNHYWRRVGARTLLSREGRRFRREVIAILAAEGVVPLESPLTLYFVAHPPDRRRRDLDNLIKSVADSLEHGRAYFDDSQIKKIVAEMREPVDGGRSFVRLEEYAP